MKFFTSRLGLTLIGILWVSLHRKAMRNSIKQLDVILFAVRLENVDRLSAGLCVESLVVLGEGEWLGAPGGVVEARRHRLLAGLAVLGNRVLRGLAFSSSPRPSCPPCRYGRVNEWMRYVRRESSPYPESGSRCQRSRPL